MELRATSARRNAPVRMENPCAQCGAPIFMPEWSEYLQNHRARYLWECESCGYRFETLVCFPEP
jgi:DNA-directed RNA polymerase subunit RPC12/RpoP